MFTNICIKSLSTNFDIYQIAIVKSSDISIIYRVYSNNAAILDMGDLNICIMQTRAISLL